MWWESAIVAVAVIASLSWLGWRFTRKGKAACDGCGPKASPTRLQTEIPVLDIGRRS